MKKQAETSWSYAQQSGTCALKTDLKSVIQKTAEAADIWLVIESLRKLQVSKMCNKVI